MCSLAGYLHFFVANDVCISVHRAKNMIGTNLFTSKEHMPVHLNIVCLASEVGGSNCYFGMLFVQCIQHTNDVTEPADRAVRSISQLNSAFQERKGIRVDAFKNRPHSI